MTTIPAVSNTLPTDTSSNSISQTYDQFLKLLVTQMQNQDPLNPSDPSKFTDQLVSFSQVEQQLKTNQNLTQLIALQGNNDLQTNLSYLNKDVVVKSNQFNHTADNTETLSYKLDASATKATATIFDANGTAIKTIPVEATAGAHNIVWDGTDEYGNKAAAGTYKVTVTAPDATNTSVGVSTYVPGRITSVTNDNGTSALMMGTIPVNRSDIIKVTQANI